MQDHIVIIGTVKTKEIMRFVMYLIDMKTFDGIPSILIIGTKLLKDTSLEKLTKNALTEMKIKYLSAVDGIDMNTYRKANIHNCKAVYIIGHLNILKSDDAYTQNLLHKIK